MKKVYLVDITTASPPFKVSQEKAARELIKRIGTRPVIARLIKAASTHSGIETRLVVLPDAADNPEERFFSKNGKDVVPTTQERMDEYEKWSKKLVYDAVGNLISRNQIETEGIRRLITISCTGFFAPGLDYFLIEGFKLRREIKRTNIGFMGCAASITGFQSVLESLGNSKNESQDALLVSIELCSLHLQLEPTRDNILSNMIFADGCAAACFSNSAVSHGAKLELIDTFVYLFEDSSGYMGWRIKNEGFQMILSPELPKIILESAAPELIKILKSNGIEKEKVKHWALHPGGRAILDSLQKGLKLSDDQMIPSRKILRNYGNMSSSS
ncbi:MAG TPA: type III polyketide synthase, partial [Ignavibacteriaceae bacterium]|nr:type III polyketide synthase [Ignavibacteriaceae bacterium]